MFLLDFDGTLITSNTSDEEGGGIFLGYGDLTIDSGTVSGNWCADGGGTFMLETAGVGSIQSINSDWGTDTTDNWANDVVVGNNRYYDYGSNESFICSQETDSCE